MDKVLEGVRVVELATFAAAPWTGRLLEDMGADVIKVETKNGDPQRTFGETMNTISTEDECPMWQCENAGKRDICLDLRTKEGMEVLLDLLKDANIFFTNIRMPSLEKMGLTYDDLKEKYPHLIYGHLSGYGLEGPDADLPGFDGTAYFSRSGALIDQAFDGDGPCALVCGVGDNITGMAFCTGLLGALYKQTKTGEGEYVLISLYGASIGAQALTIITQQEGEGYNEHYPKDRMKPPTPIVNTYMCSDGGAITLILLKHEQVWPKFCKALGREDLIEDERFATTEASQKPENLRMLVEFLIEKFKEHDTAYWKKTLSDYGLAFSVAGHYSDVHNDPMAWANGYLSKFTYRNGHTANVPNPPVHFKKFGPKEMPAAPDKGEHTEIILKEIGYDDARIQTLKEAGAVIQA